MQRYERDAPGDLIHVDIKKLGRIPDGGGWRVHGRARGTRHSRAHTSLRKGSHPVIGYGYQHAAVDDHSRLAYAEILPDEQGPTAAGFWQRANTWFAERGITVHRVLTDNGSCYRSRAKAYRSEAARRRALPAWLHTLQSPPAPHRNRRQTTRQSRPNLSGQYN